MINTKSLDYLKTEGPLEFGFPSPTIMFKLKSVSIMGLIATANAATDYSQHVNVL